jgi:hypothetical protein
MKTPQTIKLLTIASHFNIDHSRDATFFNQKYPSFSFHHFYQEEA